MTFKDHFSGHAADYAAWRPTWPGDLAGWLASISPGRDLAVDVATGNGQLAALLAPHFQRVLATDASPQQIAAATPHERVTYGVSRAEEVAVPDGSVDLLTVAQALHWLNWPAFAREAQRVLRPGGVLAACGYTGMTVDEGVDAVVGAVYAAVEDHWPPERDVLESGFAGVPLPVEELADPPRFFMEMRWTRADLEGYLGTWSAVKRCRLATGQDIVAAYASPLAQAWPDPGEARTVRFPVILRVGRVRRAAPGRPESGP